MYLRICLYIQRGLRKPHMHDASACAIADEQKNQVSFAVYRLFYRALLQKRPIVQSILLTEAAP